MASVGDRVVRTGPVQMYELARTYQCSGVVSASTTSGGGSGYHCTGNYGRGGRRGGGAGGSQQQQQQQPQKAVFCGRTFLAHADLEQRNNALQELETCPGTLPNGDCCLGNMFRVEGGSVHTDYQEIMIQDAAVSNGSSSSSSSCCWTHSTIPIDQVAA